MPHPCQRRQLLLTQTSGEPGAGLLSLMVLEIQVLGRVREQRQLGSWAGGLGIPCIHLPIHSLIHSFHAPYPRPGRL